MANKPFAIQGADLTLGGVNIQAGNAGVVIPGVTQASNYRVEEIDDFGNQSQQFTPNIDGVTVVDAALYNAIVNQLPDNHFADFTVTTDDSGYIDDIKVNGRGTYTAEEATMASDSNMYAYIGTASASDRPLVPQDWIQIPFRPRMRAGTVERAGGGSNGNSLISENQSKSAILDNDGALSIQDGSFVAYTNTNDGYSTTITPDGIDIIWNGGETGGTGAGPDGWSLNTEAGKNLYINTNGMSHTWSFGSDGGLVFPDGSIQATAYTGGVGGGTGALYIMANIDGTIITSNDGVTWSDPVASGAQGIDKVEIHDGVIVYIQATEGPSIAGLYYSTVIGSSTLCPGTDLFMGDSIFWNEVHYFSATNKWVAVGYIAGNVNDFPILAHSDNGISWTMVLADNTFVTTVNTGNANWELTDVTYLTETSQYVITSRLSSGNGGIFVTSDIAVPLDQSVYVPIAFNSTKVAPFPVVGYGGPPGYMVLVPEEGPGGSDVWFGFGTDTSNYSNSGGWWSSAVISQIGYLPNIAEVAFNATNFIATTSDGQVITPVFNIGPGPGFIVSVPLPYTTTDFSISNTNPAVLTYTLPNGTLTQNEKIVITDAGDYNGTYYWNSVDGALFVDQSLTVGFDASGLSTFTSGTLTSSHGTYFDAAGTSPSFYYIGNDDEQVFRSADGITWTEQADVTGQYFNDFAYGTFGGSGNELISGLSTLRLNARGSITFPDGSEQAGAAGQLPQWLKVVHNTQHLPFYGIDFGWDANGLWTTNATILGGTGPGPEGTSYPFRTNFTIPQDQKTIVTVDFVQGDDNQTDFGMAFFQDGVNPVWDWNGTNGGGNRIGAQYDGTEPQLHGIAGGAAGNGNINPGTCRARFTIDPTGGVYNAVTLETFDSNGYLLSTISYNDQLFTAPYRVGFASDNDGGVVKGYFKNLTIDVNNGEHVYYNTLQGDNNLKLGILKNTGWNFNYDLTGPTLRLSGPNGQDQVIITGPEPTSTSPSAQRIVIQGQRGYGRWGQNTAGEGGDVYIWGGVGGESDTGSGGSGGDIKLRGGQSYNNEGGYVKIEAGYANNFSETNYGNGGFVQINAADASGLGNGGNISLTAGIAQGSGTHGNITLHTGGSRTWTLDGSGITTLPVAARYPSTARGVAGDKAGMILVAGAYLYYCYADYTDGSQPIWQKVSMDNTDWD